MNVAHQILKFVFFSLGLETPFGMKFPLTDYGTPEEEAWRWKFVPWYIRYQRLHDTYPFTVKYYDKPEGQDLLGKVIAINRIVLPYASAAGVAAAFMHTKVTGFQATAGRIFYFVWPISGAATAFATTSYFGAKLRGKDDAYVLINHIFVIIFNNPRFSPLSVLTMELGLLQQVVYLENGKDVT